MQTNVIRRISIQATSQGVGETAGKLDRLAKAQGGVAVASDRTEKQTLSVQRAYDRLQRSLDLEYRKTKQVEAAQKTLNAAYAQGLVTLKRKNELMALSAANTNRARASLAGLNTVFAGFLGLAAARGFQQLLDAGTRIENSLRVAGLEGTALTEVYDRLYDSAQRNVAPIEALVQLYSRASLVQKELGVTTEEMLGFTDKVAVALRVSGRSAQESSGALLQLSQALGSGVVRAEEFNSILEGALPIAQAAAAGLEEAGGSVARLRQLVVDGAVSSQAFFQAFEAGSAILEQKVAGAETTVSQGFVRLQNVLIATAGKFDDATGVTKALGSAIVELSYLIEDFGDFLQDNQPYILKFFGSIGAGLDMIEQKMLEIRTNLGIEDFFEGTSLLEGRVGFASSQPSQGRTEADIRDTFKMIERSREVTVLADALAQKVAQQQPIKPVSLSDFEETQRDMADAVRDATNSLREQLTTVPETEALAGRFADAFGDVTKKVDAANKSIADVPLPRLRPEINGVEKDLIRATSAAQGFAGAFVSGLIEGDSVVSALSASIGSLSSGLGNAASGFVSKIAGGGLGGSLLGGVAGGVVGSLASGVGSIVSKIFGDDNEELKQARDAWKGMRDDFKAFRADLNGGTGSLAAAIDENRDKFHEFARAARKAGDDISGAKEELKAYEARLRSQFRSTFDGMIEGLKAGEGLSGSYAQGAKDAQDLTDTLLDFVKDAKTAFGRGPEYRKSQRAARDAALGVLHGANDNDPYMAEYRRLQGAADALRKSLKQLGMTSKQAGAAVKTELTAAIADLRDDFGADLKAKINDALGRGYVNDVADLVAEQQQLLQDAATLGTSASLVNQYFEVQAQSIIDQAELTGAAFDTLIDTFPQLSGVVHEFTGDLVTDAKAIRDANAAAASSITDYLAGLTGGSQSTLSPADRLAAAQSTYQAQLALAQGGDATAAQGITGYAEDFRSAARDFYASSQDYQDIFQQIQAELLALPAVTQTAGNDPVVAALQDTLAGILSGLTNQTSALVAKLDTNGDGQLSKLEIIGANTGWLPQIKSGTDNLSGIKGGTDKLGGIKTGTDNLGGIKGGTDELTAVSTYTGNTDTALNDGANGVKKWSKNTAQAAKAAGLLNATWLPLISARLAEISTFVAGRGDKSFKSTLDWALFKDLKKGNKPDKPTGSDLTDIRDIASGFDVTFKEIQADTKFQHGGIVPGYAGGGIVTNGIFNRDSVLARYAGGGMIGLAGGEGIITAPAVQRIGAGAIDAINRGQPVASDNAEHFKMLSRVLMAGFEGSTKATVAALARIADRLDALERRDRIEASREPRRRKAA